MDDVNAIFDAVGKASSYVYLQDAIHDKQKQIMDVLSKRCGHCFHWMKSSCIPEKKHKQFKHCESPGCSEFERHLFSEELAVKFENELAELKKRLADLTLD